LKAAARPVLTHAAGEAAVGVSDLDTGSSSWYSPSGHAFSTASIVKVDILAVLLLDTQDAHRYLTGTEDARARRMIEISDNGAASRLWDEIGGAAGLAAGNARLGLTGTTPGTGGYWGLTTTTPGDQLRLLGDVFTIDSPLDAAARGYAIELMQQVRADQRFGVSAAADAGSTVALKDGWLKIAATGRWTINSIGQVTHHGRPLLIVVLCNDQPSEAAGIALAEKLADGAASAADSAAPA
jgi:hypothetical protein